MAVEKTKTIGRVGIGANVIVAIVIVVAIVGVLQAAAFSLPGARVDMTQSSVNSLTPGTRSLLDSLDTNVRLTSLYFETDLEDKDQSLYRRAAKDLIDLYASAKRTRITADYINPLADHDKMKELVARLKNIERFKKQIEPHQKAIEKYKTDLDEEMRGLIAQEAQTVNDLASAAAASQGGEKAAATIAQMQQFFQRWSSELATVREQVDALTVVGNEQPAAATSVIQTAYREFTRGMGELPRFADAELMRNPDMPEDVRTFLRGLGQRLADVVANVQAGLTEVEELPELELEKILLDLAPDANAILVETDSDAIVVNFTDIFPPTDPNRTGRVPFKDRAFQGELQLTTAILRITSGTQTAVVFVRYGGMPLFVAPSMPGQPPMRSDYQQVRERLEDLNFNVMEWDLKSSTTPPTITPEPDGIVWVVLRPTPPQGNPFQQQGQDQPFGAVHREALVSAMGDAPRALFIGGWMPGPFPGMPGTYDYNEYLASQWGVEVDAETFLIQTVNFEPGKYIVSGQNFFTISEVERGSHPIVEGASARVINLPWTAPIERSNDKPENVKISTLLSAPESDTLWGVKNIQAYQEQINEQGFMSRIETDEVGPFELAIAAEKTVAADESEDAEGSSSEEGETARLVLVSSRDFAVDAVAFAQGLAFTSQGMTIRALNPGNIALLVNSLHWLSGHEQFMQIGEPIDVSTLAINDKKTETAVSVLTIFVWPALALFAGGIAWWSRRR